jgi:3-oxoacyl-(acyl-carrier-protein) synthase
MIPEGVSSWLEWSPAQGLRASFPTEGLGPFGLDVDESLRTIHPRMRRPDGPSALLVRLGHLLLASTGVPAVLEETGIILGTSAGSAVSDEAFRQSVRDRGAAFGSPSLFVYTLSTAALAEMSIALRLGGPVVTVSAGAASVGEALASAWRQVRSGRLQTCIAGSFELGTKADRITLVALQLENQSHKALWPRSS